MFPLSGKMFRITFPFVLVFHLSLATKQQLPICKKSNSTTDLCTLVENYNPLIPPKNPKPCLIEPRVVISTIEIDEKSQVLTLLMELKLSWIDKKLNLKNYHSSWFQLNGWHFDEVWNPSVHFEKLIDTKKISEFGKNNNIKSWFHNESRNVYYSELIEVSFACSLDFTGFPKDDHVCNFEFGTSTFGVNTVEYSSPIIIYQSNRAEKDNESLIITMEKFFAEIKPLQPFYKQFSSYRIAKSSAMT